MSGLSPEQTALMLELMAAVTIDARPAVDEQAERRRAKDRERKRALTPHTPQTPRNSAETAEVVEDTPSPSSPNENNLTPSTHTPGNTPRARKGSASVGCRLPANWQPQPLTGAVGDASAAWPPGSLERELERFRDWAASATGPHARKSDWQAAWRNWIRKAEDEGRYRNGTARRNCGTAANRGDGFGNALREMSGDWGADYRG